MIYDSIYNLITTYVFNGVVNVGTYQELITILVSTFGTLFIVAIPFIVVYRVIKLLVGG